jgi:hypothetical protein
MMMRLMWRLFTQRKSAYIKKVHVHINMILIEVRANILAVKEQKIIHILSL